MRAQIVQIGNSQGVRIPKALLQESGIKGDVELELCQEGILIRNVQKPRSEWNEQFKQFAEHDDDHPVHSDDPTVFEVKEWQW